MSDPAECATMSELRAGIDAIDQELIALLARRAGFIDRAIELKPAEGIPANAPDRVEQVVCNVRRLAADCALAPDLAESLWRILIDWSIEREERVLGR